MDDNSSSSPRTLLQGFMDQASPHETPLPFKQSTGHALPTGGVRKVLRSKLLQRCSAADKLSPRSKSISQSSRQPSKQPTQNVAQRINKTNNLPKSVLLSSVREDEAGHTAGNTTIANTTYANISLISSDDSILEQRERIRETKRRKLARVASMAAQPIRQTKPLSDTTVAEELTRVDATYTDVSISNSFNNNTLELDKERIANRRKPHFKDVYSSSQPVSKITLMREVASKSMNVTMPENKTYFGAGDVSGSSEDSINLAAVRMQKGRMNSIISNKRRADHLGSDDLPRNKLMRSELADTASIDDTYAVWDSGMSSSDESIDVDQVRQRREKRARVQLRAGKGSGMRQVGNFLPGLSPNRSTASSQASARNSIALPRSSPRKSTVSPPMSPINITGSPIATPRKSPAFKQVSLVKPTALPRATPLKFTASPQGTPMKSTRSHQASLTKSTTSPQVTPIKSTASPRVTRMKATASPRVTPTKLVVLPLVSPWESIESPRVSPRKSIASQVSPRKSIVFPEMSHMKTIASQVSPSNYIASPQVSPRKSIASPDVSPAKSIASPRVSPRKTIASPKVSPSKSIASPRVSPRKTIACPQVSPSKSIASPQVSSRKTISSPQVSSSKFIASQVSGRKTISFPQVSPSKFVASSQESPRKIDASPQVSPAKFIASTRVSPRKTIPPSPQVPPSKLIASPRVSPRKTVASPQVSPSKFIASPQVSPRKTIPPSPQVPPSKFIASPRVSPRKTVASPQVSTSKTIASPQVSSRTSIASPQASSRTSIASTLVSPRTFIASPQASSRTSSASPQASLRKSIVSPRALLRKSSASSRASPVKSKSLPGASSRNFSTSPQFSPRISSKSKFSPKRTTASRLSPPAKSTASPMSSSKKSSASSQLSPRKATISLHLSSNVSNSSLHTSSMTSFPTQRSQKISVASLVSREKFEPNSQIIKELSFDSSSNLDWTAYTPVHNSLPRKSLQNSDASPQLSPVKSSRSDIEQPLHLLRSPSDLNRKSPRTLLKESSKQKGTSDILSSETISGGLDFDESSTESEGGNGQSSIKSSIQDLVTHLFKPASPKKAAHHEVDGSLASDNSLIAASRDAAKRRQLTSLPRTKANIDMSSLIGNALKLQPPQESPARASKESELILELDTSDEDVVQETPENITPPAEFIILNSAKRALFGNSSSGVDYFVLHPNNNSFVPPPLEFDDSTNVQRKSPIVSLRTSPKKNIAEKILIDDGISGSSASNTSNLVVESLKNVTRFAVDSPGMEIFHERSFSALDHDKVVNGKVKRYSPRHSLMQKSISFNASTHQVDAYDSSKTSPLLSKVSQSAHSTSDDGSSAPQQGSPSKTLRSTTVLTLPRVSIEGGDHVRDLLGDWTETEVTTSEAAEPLQNDAVEPNVLVTNSLTSTSKYETSSSKAVLSTSQSTFPSSKPMSPSAKAMSPSGNALSPSAKALSPSAEALSSSPEALSPNAKALSPSLKVLSSTETLVFSPKTMSSSSKTMSPNSKTMSPNSKTMSPHAQTAFPNASKRASIPDNISPCAMSATRSDLNARGTSLVKTQQGGNTPKVMSSASKQTTLKDFLQVLSRKDYQAYRSSGLEKTKTEMMSILNNLKEKSSTEKKDGAMAPPKMKGVRPKEWTTLPYQYHRDAFNHFSKRKNSKVVISEVVKASEVFFANMLSDVMKVATAKEHRSVHASDVVYLLKKQGLVDSSDGSQSLNALVEEFLPLDEWPHTTDKKNDSIDLL